MKNHPLPAMLKAGLQVMINSDDPAYFGGYLNENYAAISGLLDNDKNLLAKLAVNSFTSAFLSDENKVAAIAKVNDYLARHNSN